MHPDVSLASTAGGQSTTVGHHQSSTNGTIGVRPGWVCALDATVPDTGAYFDDDDKEEEEGGGEDGAGVGGGGGGGEGRTPARGVGASSSSPGNMDYSYMGARAAVAKYLTGSM